MKPGQLEPNDLERAVLRRMATREPVVRDAMDKLHVLSRQFTGVGSFTNFLCDISPAESHDRHVDLDVPIRMPGVPNGLGAVLFMKAEQPQYLELYSYGDELWDGTYDGFSLGDETA